MAEFDFSDAVNPFQSPPPQDFSDAVNPFQEPESRGITGVVSDLWKSYAGGANALLKIGGDLYGLTTGDMDNWASNQGRRGQEFWNERKSDQLKTLESQRKEKVDSAETDIGKAATAFWETVKSPSLLTSFLFEQAPMLLPVAGVGRGAAAASKALGATASTAARAGTGAAVATGGAMQGSDAGSQAYEQLMSVPDDVWMLDRDVAGRVNAGEPLEEVKRERALSLSRNSAVASTIASIGLNMIPGARVLESRLAGGRLPGGRLANFAKGFVGESLQEGLEEGSGALFANLAGKTVDETIQAMEGVGEATGLGATSGFFGGAAGVSSSVDTQQQVDRILESETIDEAIAEADEALRTVQPGESIPVEPFDTDNIPTVQYSPPGDSAVIAPEDFTPTPVRQAETEQAYEITEEDIQRSRDTDYQAAVEQRAEQEVGSATQETEQQEILSQYSRENAPPNTALRDAFLRAQQTVSEPETAQDAPQQEVPEIEQNQPLSTIPESALEGDVSDQFAPQENVSRETIVDQEVTNDQEWPDILTQSKDRYLKKMIRNEGLRKDSPGYEDAVSRLEDQYETDYDRALASISFEQYKELNPGQPESLLRQVYDGLQEEYGQDQEGGPLFSQPTEEVNPETLPETEQNEYEQAVAKGLPMDRESRLKRAKEMGYNTEAVLYHGTDKDIGSFDPRRFGESTEARSARQGVWLVNAPDTARGYAEHKALSVPVRNQLKQAEVAERKGDWDSYESAVEKAESMEKEFYNERNQGQVIYPVLTRGTYASYDARGQEFTDIQDQINREIRNAKADGLDGVIFENLADDVGFNNRPAEHVVVFDPANIRSVNAAFDPDFQDSGNLLASRLIAQEGETGSNLETVQTAVSGAIESLGADLDVEVVQSADSLPEALRSQITGRPKGVYQDGKVYLVADNIRNKHDAEVVFAHEVVGHKGVLEMASPEEWTNIKGQIEQMLSLKNSTAQSIMKEVHDRYDKKDANGNVIEPVDEETGFKEFLAVAAERRVKQGQVGRVLTKVKEIIRRFLKSIGLKGPFAESEIETILSNSERYLRESSEASVENQQRRQVMDDIQAESALFSQDAFEEDPDLERIADKVLATPKSRRSLSDRVKEILNKHADSWKLWAKQGAVDQFASIADYEIKQYGNLRDAKDSAYKAAAFSKNSNNVLDAAMRLGAVQYKDGGIELVENSEGLLQILEPLAQTGLTREWELWAGAKRAKRLLAEGRERNYSKEDIETVLNAVTGKKLKFFEAINTRWQRYNKQTLDFAESAGLISAEDRKIWEKDDYVPFHRVSEFDDVSTSNMTRKGGLSGQQSGIRKLEGGVQKVSIVESMVRNTAHMIDASMKNVAMQRTLDLAEEAGVVEKVKDSSISESEAREKLNRAGIDYNEDTFGLWKKLLEKNDARNGTVSVSRDGRTERYIVHDPILLRSMTSLGPTGVEGIMRVLRIPKRLLTELVTADPSFSLRNLIRDTLSTFVTVHGAKRNPIADAVRGVVSAYRESDTLKAMSAQGVGGGGFYDVSPDGVRAHLEKVSGDGSVITSLAELWEGYKKILGTTENANRIAVYEAALKNGASKAEAAYQAMDVLNFSRHGEWKAIRMLIELVPFMNARIQGLDRLYRGATEGGTQWHHVNKEFMLKGSMLVGATLALLAANWDNDDYWDLEEWERDTYYHFFVNGQHYRLPKPFEVGAIFSTVPERMFEQMRDDANMKLLANRMLSMIADTFSFDPTPQFVKPAVEVATNKSSFTGRTILSEGMKYASPEAQYTPYSSKTMIEIADAMPDSAPEWMRSPARLEHLFRGYLGALGGYALMASDFLVREATGSPERPEARIRDVPILQSFIRDGVGSNKQVGRLYDMSKDVNEIYTSIRKYRLEGQKDKAQELMQDNAGKLRARRGLNKAVNSMSGISSRIKRIYDNPNMTAAEKRLLIDMLVKRRNELAKRYEELFREEF